MSFPWHHGTLALAVGILFEPFFVYLSIHECIWMSRLELTDAGAYGH